MKVLSLFSGIGAFESALKRLGREYELVNYCEIDKYASKGYAAIHNVPESLNLGDITKVDTSTLPKDIDLITYGFPCQDISLAGHQKGLFNEDGTKTRSGLFFEALRIIEDTKPKVAIAENVKNLVGKKFKEQFEIVLKSLEDAGYNNYWKVLNAKDFGVPQNRERVFIVSIRKDIDKGFTFPQEFPLELRLKDLLEEEVNEKFYLFGDFVEKEFSINNSSQSCIQVGNLKGGKWDKANESCRRVYLADGLSPTILTCQGENTEPKVLLDKPILLGGIGEKKSNNGTQWYQQNRVYDSNGIAMCHPANIPQGSYKYAVDNLRIRKLTPKECYRLMGFTDAEFQRVADIPTSNTQLYKMAGNSIVVDVLVHLIKGLWLYL